MTWRWMLAGLLVAGFMSCTEGTGRPTSKDDPVGVLAMNLTGTDSHGDRYRLRNAEFDISGYNYYPYPNQGPPLITVSSEADPDADVIDTQLVPGTYYVTLSNHLWYLEKLTDQGPERVQQAVLLSAESTYAYVYEGSTSSVYFTFGVDGELIDFRHGNLQIGISIEHPGEEDGGTPMGGMGGSPDQDGGTP